MTELILFLLSKVGQENSIILEWRGITTSEGSVEKE